MAEVSKATAKLPSRASTTAPPCPARAPTDRERVPQRNFERRSLRDALVDPVGEAHDEKGLTLARRGDRDGAIVCPGSCSGDR